MKKAQRAVSVSSISVASVWVGIQQGVRVEHYADALWGQKQGCSMSGVLQGS